MYTCKENYIRENILESSPMFLRDFSVAKVALFKFPTL